MKKIKFLLGIISIICLVSFVFWGCKDKDKFPPLIYINGGESVSTELGKVYTDLGASSEDNFDGNLTGSIVTSNNILTRIAANGDIVTAKAGEYEVLYSVTDKAGNVKEATRNVSVKNWAWKFASPIQFQLSRKKITPGTDSVGCQYAKKYYRKVVQKVSITPDKSENRKIRLPLGGEIKVMVEATFLGDNNIKIKIEQQKVKGQEGYKWTESSSYIDTASVTYNITGMGADRASSYVADTTAGKKKIIIKYLISKESSLVAPIEYTDTLLQIW